MRAARYQPQGAVKLNTSNPLTQGAFVYPLAAHNTILGASNGIPNIAGGVAKRAGPIGLYYSLTSAQSDFIRLGADSRMQAEAFSALMVIKFDAFPSNGNSFTIFESGALTDQSYQASNGSFQFRVGDAGDLQVIKDNTVAIYAGAAAALSLGKWSTISLSFASGSPGALSIAVNGRIVGQHTPTISSFKAGDFTLGTKDGTTNEKGPLDVALFAYWPRTMQSFEQVTLSRNPWQLFAAPHEDDDPAPAGLTLTPIAAALSMTGLTATISQARTLAPATSSLTLTGYAPTITQPLTLAPAGAALTLAGGRPTVTQVAPQTISPTGAVLSLVGSTPGVMQGAQAPPPAAGGGGGGGGGSVRETRAFADMLDRARKPTRSEKRKRRQVLEADALELLPDLPEAEKLAPIAARIVFEQEARALAPLYAGRPIQALVPVVAPFDTHAALRDLVARLVAEAQLHDADDESDIELLLLGI